MEEKKCPHCDQTLEPNSSFKFLCHPIKYPTAKCRPLNIPIAKEEEAELKELSGRNHDHEGCLLKDFFIKPDQNHD